jgi:hypothetical protein
VWIIEGILERISNRGHVIEHKMFIYDDGEYINDKPIEY